MSTHHASDAQRPRHFLTVCTLTVFAWVAAAAWLNQSQLNDSLEQFAWGQSFEWGYWKHPPLTSWLIGLGFRLFDVSAFAPYAWAALLFALTIFFSWKIAARLLPPAVAPWVPMLLTLHYGFTRRAQIYNHNTVLLCAVALAVWTLLVALDSQKLRHWALFGFAAGLALLTKYQAVVPLGCLLLVMVHLRLIRPSLRGIVLASLVAAAMVLPHLHWLIVHDWLPVRYAMHYTGEDEATPHDNRIAPFVAAQLRFYAPLLMFVALSYATRWLLRTGTPARIAFDLDARQRAWLVGLVALPFFGVLIAAVTLNVRLQSNWGLQLTQFLPLLLAILLAQRLGNWNARHWRVWAVVQVFTLGFMVGQGLGLFDKTSSRQTEVRDIPARAIGAEAVAFWRTHTRCPLRYVTGHDTAAFIVAGYSGEAVRVLEDGDPNKSPWIDLDDMRSRGSLVIHFGEAAAAEEHTVTLAPPHSMSAPLQIAMQVVAPARDCAP